MGRVTCEKCNITLNEYFDQEKINKLICNGKYLLKRKDDNLETILNRYDKYIKTTKPVLDFLSKKTPLHEVDGTLKIEEITSKIKHIIKGYEVDFKRSSYIKATIYHLFMARIAGINIPQNKLVHIGLTYIYGIGDKFSNQICSSLEIPREKRVNELTDDEILKIREYIDLNFKVEGDLRRDYSLSIKRLIDLACYRGSRHRKKLPVRGQRTRCNARTRKGKAIAIAGKKLTPTKK